MGLVMASVKLTLMRGFLRRQGLCLPNRRRPCLRGRGMLQRYLVDPTLMAGFSCKRKSIT
jgi:hypothetical protein